MAEVNKNTFTTNKRGGGGGLPCHLLDHHQALHSAAFLVERKAVGKRNGPGYIPYYYYSRSRSARVPLLGNASL